MGLDNPLHIAILLIVLLLVFGAKRLPEMGRSIGSGMREFKDSISGDAPALTQTTSQQPQAPAQPVAAQAQPPAPEPVVAQAPAQPPTVQQAAQAFGEAPPAQAPAEPT